METGGEATYVVKNRRHQQVELFDQEKLIRSIIASCLSSGVPAGQADSIASQVAKDVLHWLEKRPEVTANDIRRVASKHLKTYHPDASYLYEHHRTTL